MAETIRLNFIDQLAQNLKASTQFIQVLLGPRQVGKTTSILHFLEQNFKEKSHYASADQVFHSSPQWIIEQWNSAIEANGARLD